MLGNRVWATFTFLVRIQCGQRLASPLVTDGGKKRRLRGERDVVRVFFLCRSPRVNDVIYTGRADGIGPIVTHIVKTSAFACHACQFRFSQM